MLDERKRELARHALGLPNKENKTYRNRFFTSLNSPDYKAWEEMKNEGLATRQIMNGWGGDYFYLTLAGARWAKNKNEKLCPEDFPKATQAEGEE